MKIIAVRRVNVHEFGLVSARTSLMNFLARRKRNARVPDIAIYLRKFVTQSPLNKIVRLLPVPIKIITIHLHVS